MACAYLLFILVYVDVGKDVKNKNGYVATIEFVFAKVTGKRQFNIRVSQIDSLTKPPDGCLQYFTGVTGNWHF